MLGNISGPTLIVILFIVLLLFGAPKLPALARSLGQSMKILKKEVGPENEGKGKGSKGAPAAEATPDESVTNHDSTAETATPIEASDESAKKPSE